MAEKGFFYSECEEFKALWTETQMHFLNVKINTLNMLILSFIVVKL